MISDKLTLIYISGYISAMWSCEQQGVSCNIFKVISDKFTLIYISGYISAMWSCEQQGASCNQVIPAPLAQEYKSDLHQSHCKQNRSNNYIQKVFFLQLLRPNNQWKRVRVVEI